MLRTRQSGFTLIELMIGITISLIVIAGALTIYTSTARSGAQNIQSTRMAQDMRSTLSIISADLRRAGYYGGAPGTDNFTTNPFMEAPNDIDISRFTGEANNSCITYTYDRDEDTLVDTGTVDTDGDGVIDAADMEQYGFRLRNGRVEMRTGGKDFSCTALVGWEAITDSSVLVTQLSFTLQTACLSVSDGSTTCPCTSGSACQIMRDVDTSLVAQRVIDANIGFQATESIQIRNHRFMETAP